MRHTSGPVDDDQEGRQAATGSRAVLDTGPPAGPAGLPVVLLHGWTGSGEDFAPIIDALAARRRVVVPDLPGHGGTAPAPEEDYSLPAHVRFVQALLGDTDIADLHLVAHSHGGLVAQRVAWAMAHRIASLTLIGSGAGALGDDAREMVVRVATAARDRGMAAAWRAAQGAPSGDGVGTTAEVQARMMSDREAFERRRFLAMTPAAVIGGARNLVTAMPLGAFLHGIDFPVLVCHGEGDTMWLPHEQRLLARRIPGATYRVIPGALHSPAQENPEGLLAELLPFLASADPAKSTTRS